MTWRKFLLPFVIAVCALEAMHLRVAAQPIAPNAADSAAINQFEAAIEKYLALRRRLLAEVPGPTPESSAPKLTQASDGLAAAIQRSRPKARPGDLFVAPAATVIKRRVAEAVQNDNLGSVLATIDDEEPGPKGPAVHMRFPAASPMATMPPSLLAVLPKLPKELEYRIIGNYLILRDVDAALILDIIPAAVPR
ncbi:MAG TPA: hypothetical protein VM096_04580 [Vicinamibacterales bacterium]|nr:hypothetical protein [Vicinamibacterales bacterium]